MFYFTTTFLTVGQPQNFNICITFLVILKEVKDDNCIAIIVSTDEVIMFAGQDVIIAIWKHVNIVDNEAPKKTAGAWPTSRSLTSENPASISDA